MQKGEELPHSPRITSLYRRLSGGDSTALDEFWKEIGRSGTPLVEPLDDDHVLVTFIWRAKDDEIHNVLIPLGLGAVGDFSGNLMIRMLNTDLWYKTYRARADIRATYMLSPNDSLAPFGDYDEVETRLSKFIADPLNSNKFLEIHKKDGKDLVFSESILELPKAPAQPWIASRPNVPKGTLTKHLFKSEILHNTRDVWAYTPSGYSANEQPLNLVIFLDGYDYIEYIPTPTILDNLTAEDKIPPTIAIFVDAIDTRTRKIEMPCYQPFVDSIQSELVPWIRKNYNVTSDPHTTTIAGASYGGLAAGFTGYRASRIFGNVLSQSASFGWPAVPWVHDDVDTGWLIRQFTVSEKLPLRFYIDVGLLERSIGVDQVTANRHMRDVLQAKGYDLQYVEFAGGHDYICWRGTLPDGLTYLCQ
ncbi:MAG: enterochelin esterase [Candidatus Bathyarchaeia archaeon]